jgi:hypothetical protein
MVGGSEDGECGEEVEEPVVRKKVVQEAPRQTSQCIEQTPRRVSKARRSASTAGSPLTSREKAGRGAAARKERQGEASSGGGAGDVGVVGVGSVVIARWRNNSWYPATVTDCKNGRLSIQYEDGDRSAVSISHVFHRSQLKPNMSVIAMDDTKRGRHGHFGGFTDPSMSDWYLRPLSSGAGRETYKCDQLEVPATTAEICMSGNSRGVKRGRSEVLVSPAVKKRRMRPSQDEGEESLSDVTESLPPNQRNLFEGFSFLLTHRPKEDKHYATPPNEKLDKEIIASQIRSRMGHILENTDQGAVDGQCYVLSDACCRTRKYLLGLALSLPCISYGWITECINKGELVDHSLHLLPAGLAAGSGEVVPWQPRTPGHIMVGVAVALEGSKDFKEFWSSILQNAGATVKADSGVVVSESGKQKQLQTRQRGRTDRVPQTLVRSEWLAQCLIQAEVLNWGPFTWPSRGV